MKGSDCVFESRQRRVQDPRSLISDLCSPSPELCRPLVEGRGVAPVSSRLVLCGYSRLRRELYI